MSKCNCGCNSSPCKNLNASDIAKLEFVQGLDESGCPKYENISTLLPVVHPAATLTNNVAPFSWNVATQSGNIPRSSHLVANADGSFTMIHGDGSPNVTIPKDCCPVMTQSGNTITFTNGDGSVVTFTLHPAATLTNNAAPFLWDVTTQSGNVPQASHLVANADGSFTMIHGDGSPNVTIPKDCCPTMNMSGNTVTFTNGDGSVVTFTLHPAATLTNNAAPFSWNAVSQTGNVPKEPVLTLTATGFLFVPGDGSSPVVYTEPADVDTYITGWSIVGNQATITRSDGVSFVQTIPTTVDINVQSFVLSGSNLQLTETDGTVHTVPLPQEVKVNAVSYSPATGVLTVSNTDGTNVSTTIDVCATLVTLPTGSAGVAGTTQFLGKDCEWHALPTAGITAQTPLTATDSTSINFTTSGTDQHTLTGAVIVAPTVGNALTSTATGLFVANDTPLTANDSATIDFTTSGTDQHTLTGAVKISATANNAVVANADGLFVANDTPLTANDSATINFTTSGTDQHTLTGAVKISAANCNMLEALADGLFVQDYGSPEYFFLGIPGVSYDHAALLATAGATTVGQTLPISYTNNNCFPVILLGFLRVGTNTMFAFPGTRVEVGHEINNTGAPTLPGGDIFALENGNANPGHISVSTPGAVAIWMRQVLAPGASYNATAYKTFTVQSLSSVPGATDFLVLGSFQFTFLVIPAP